MKAIQKTLTGLSLITLSVFAASCAEMGHGSHVKTQETGHPGYNPQKESRNASSEHSHPGNPAMDSHKKSATKPGSDNWTSKDR